jgi:hypothetical protein
MGNRADAVEIVKRTELLRRCEIKRKQNGSVFDGAPVTLWGNIALGMGHMPRKSAREPVSVQKALCEEGGLRYCPLQRCGQEQKQI